MIKNRLAKVYSKTLVDKSFQFEKVQFIKQERSGEIKYLLSYKTHKQIDIMVIKSIEHKEFISSEISLIYKKNQELNNII